MQLLDKAGPKSCATTTTHDDSRGPIHAIPDINSAPTLSNRRPRSDICGVYREADLQDEQGVGVGNRPSPTPNTLTTSGALSGTSSPELTTPTDSAHPGLLLPAYHGHFVSSVYRTQRAIDIHSIPIPSLRLICRETWRTCGCHTSHPVRAPGTACLAPTQLLFFYPRGAYPTNFIQGNCPPSHKVPCLSPFRILARVRVRMTPLPLQHPQPPPHRLILVERAGAVRVL